MVFEDMFVEDPKEYCAHLTPNEQITEERPHTCRLKQLMGIEDVSCVASDYSALLSDTEGRGDVFFYKGRRALRCPLYETDEVKAWAARIYGILIAKDGGLTEEHWVQRLGGASTPEMSEVMRQRVEVVFKILDSEFEKNRK